VIAKVCTSEEIANWVQHLPLCSRLRGRALADVQAAPGFAAQENKVHVHDLHATVLALLGFDHTKLTYRYAGRDFRLTDVYGKVVHDLIA